MAEKMAAWMAEGMVDKKVAKTAVKWAIGMVDH